MTLGTTVLGQATLGGGVFEPAAPINYVNCQAQILCISLCQGSINASMADVKNCAAIFEIECVVLAALTIGEPPPDFEGLWNESLWNAATWNGPAFIVPLPPQIGLPLHIVDMVQVRGTLEAWNMLVANGLSDAMVANSYTVEAIELEARLLVGHIEYERLLVRSRQMLRRAEEMGVLTDIDIAGATTTAEVTAILTALNGEVDRDIYSAFYQGT